MRETIVIRETIVPIKKDERLTNYEKIISDVFKEQNYHRLSSVKLEEDKLIMQFDSHSYYKRANMVKQVCKSKYTNLQEFLDDLQDHNYCKKNWRRSNVDWKKFETIDLDAQNIWLVFFVR